MAPPCWFEITWGSGSCIVSVHARYDDGFVPNVRLVLAAQNKLLVPPKWNVLGLLWKPFCRATPCWSSARTDYRSGTRTRRRKMNLQKQEGMEHVTMDFNTYYLLIRNAESRFNLLATDFFFQILAHPVFKMWVIQKPNKVALWNKRHFEEKKRRLYSMFKIFSTDICWINIKWGIQRAILRPSYI